MVKGQILFFSTKREFHLQKKKDFGEEMIKKKLSQKKKKKITKTN